MPVRAPLPVLLHGATVVAILLAASAIISTTPAAAANNHGGGGRMVIIRAPPHGTTTTSAAAVRARSRSRWLQQRRRVEDEVAPEFAGLLGAVDDPTAASSLVPGQQVCIGGKCVAAGQSYIRPCTYGTQCNGGG
ncbi:hypothetical protein HU200_052734 [Digitaria exilis]|uniref:Uncharacterized protein n=1 Tax=Digitaria exilis TaxID=1010633 RepID=A0A835E3W4_9POAL|nr:hypothetical protein HU200_052734 [Digitaria exilis]CAB3466250.1 unnamed protein product [Digitaria exilis]